MEREKSVMVMQEGSKTGTLFFYSFFCCSLSPSTLYFSGLRFGFERFGWKGGGILMDRLGLMCSGSTRVWILDGGV